MAVPQRSVVEALATAGGQTPNRAGRSSCGWVDLPPRGETSSVAAISGRDAMPVLLCVSPGSRY